MKLSLLVLFLLIFFANPCAQAWNGATVSASASWNAEPALFPNPYASTTWGCLKEAQDEFSDEELLDLTIYQHTEFYGKALPALLLTQKAGTSPFNRNAPLMVILPGIFGSAFDGNQIAKANDFYRSGYHVLVLSNPWSANSLSHDPKMKPGEVIQEGNWVLASIREAIAQDLSAQYIQSISLYGESYGSFLAGVATGLDTQSLITGETRIVSPPLDMISALREIDTTADQSKSMDGYCSKNILKVGLQFLRAKVQTDIPALDVQCSQSLVAMRFQGSLGDAMKALQKTRLQVPTSPSVSTYEYYLENFIPEMNQLCASTDQCTLQSWLKKAIASGHPQISLVSAKDDFLNAHSDWSSVRALLPNPDSQLLLLNWGGHLGYVSTPSFSHALYTH